jgi:iron-sulfur cluster repair protein YtfE (RIC family)
MTTLAKLSPSVTKMIRLDHTHVLSTWHGYEAGIAPWRKKAIAEVICLALEIHAQLEEEIFYPALQAAAPDDETLAKARPEHDEMRRLIAKLRGLEPADAQYDATLHELMRDVMHHVADEETVLLPLAERLLADRLGELGARMTKRRLALIAPHTGELAVNHARAMPVATGLLAAGALATGYLLRKSFERSA